ncbi:MAG: glycosyltransferase family 2 protein [Mariprofundaceae bacterium]|nr:glycosyltransferase family 2 protein [Mariprofundaceae bacterium]
MNHNPDSLAVVISTYNAPEMLRLALNGYNQQTDQRFRLYIADDGSVSETKDVIDAFRTASPIPVKHVWHADKGFRKSHIHNKVIARLQDDYVLFTDGDCIPLPGLVAVHRRVAKQNCFVSGSRILLSREWSKLLKTRDAIDTHIDLFQYLTWRVRGHVNRVLPLLLPPHTSAPHQRLGGIRGCHLACWRRDLLKINGFDESFEGWGREDSDFAARLLHAGVRRVDLRGVPVLHLWHKEESRHHLRKNDDMLHECLASKRIRARIGIAELTST